MKEIFELMREHKKEKHSAWFEKNMDILKDTNHIFKDTVLLFRESGKPKVDFYLHTGRWKVKTKMYRGGAESFLMWYAKQ